MCHAYSNTNLNKLHKGTRESRRTHYTAAGRQQYCHQYSHYSFAVLCSSLKQIVKSLTLLDISFPVYTDPKCPSDDQNQKACENKKRCFAKSSQSERIELSLRLKLFIKPPEGSMHCKSIAGLKCPNHVCVCLCVCHTANISAVPHFVFLLTFIDI